VVHLLPPPTDHRRVVRVLAEDPDLAAGIPADARPRATEHVRAEALTVEHGAWHPGRKRTDAALGLLVLDGLISRRVRLGQFASTELLGAGDVVQPWDEGGEPPLVPSRVEWEVLLPARLAVLDHRFTASAQSWPQISSVLLGRAFRRTRWQGLLLALVHFPRVDVRLLVLFWHLAERWGRVGREGMLVPLPLTHEALARLVGARRPTVTTALGGLRRRDWVYRRADGHWVLTAGGRSKLLGVCGADRGDSAGSAVVL
jgi:CRP/FNR family transcriptional regulator, cyclic AMP receptor protein